MIHCFIQDSLDTSKIERRKRGQYGTIYKLSVGIANSSYV